MISFPNAKINLGLNVLSKREDGYHNVNSLIYPVRLSDVLEVVEARKFSFSTSGLIIPGVDADNLVVKAYHLLRKDFDLPAVSIHLHKTVPAGAGLGGGSSDGAFMLKMLNAMFELFLDDAILEDYALQLGSDCPFFIRNEPAFVSGKGDALEKSELELKELIVCIVKPERGISTADAYRTVSPGIPDKDIRKIVEDHPVEAWRGILLNDFEEAFYKKLPEYGEIKHKLYEAGALYASMSGSGSAFYGIFRDSPELKGAFPDAWFTWEGTL